MDIKPWTIKFSTLNKRLNAFTQGYRQNVAFLGNDPEETSYILEKYLQTDKPENIICIHISTSYVGKKEFFKTLVFSLLSDYADKDDTLDNLIHHANLALNSTTEFIKNCLKKEDISFLDVLEVINKAINESKKKCLLIVEEFLGITDIFDDFYQNFSKFIILQKNCMIVLTASNSKSAQKVLSGELNLLFGNFEKIFLGEKYALDNFIYLKEEIAPITPSPFFLSFFITIVGSNIAYYDLIAKEIKNSYNPDDEEGSIVEIIKKTLGAKETYFFQKFIKKTELLRFNFKDFISTLKLLLSLSEGYLRKNELTSLEICSSKELSVKLQKLLDLNYVENLGNIYKLKDTLFSFWLENIFKLYFSPAVFDCQRRTSIYTKRLQERLTLFKEEFLKDKLKKILQLFSSFKDDTLQFGKNKYTLPYIEKSKIISCPQKHFHLLIGEGKEIIFAGIKENGVEDNDIFEFIEQGINIRGKRVRKIFVSLDSLPSTARLIAKNNKLTIWDANDINRLLNIYNKPMVSCGLELKNQAD